MNALLSVLILWQVLILTFNLGSVSITTPSSDPKARIAAGTSTTVTLSYSPSSSVVQSTVTLTCPSTLETSVTFTGTTTSFDVPSTLYGDNCTFSVIANGYTSTNTVNVTITQPLTFTSPLNNSFITINNPISVAMSTGSVNASASVTLQFACTNYVTSIPTFTIITSSYLPYSYNSYPSTAYGPCTLSVSSAPDYMVYPSPLSISLKYSLSITNRSTMHIGQQFLVNVSSSVTPVVTTVTLNLVYSPTGSSPITVQSYSGIVINQQTTLLAPTNLSTGSGYTLQVAADANFNSATSSTFSAARVQLRFAQPPTGSTYVYPKAIPILINSANVPNILPSNQPINVTFSCSGRTIERFSVIIGTQTTYTNSYLRVGICSFSATSSVSYLTSPTSRSVTINGTVALSSVASSVSAGGTVQLDLTYDPFATDVSSSIVLKCPNLNPETALVTGMMSTFTVPAGLYGAPCVFSVNSQNYTSNNTVNTIVTQMLSISSPTISISSITIDDPIPIIVSTSPNITISEIINLKFNCSSPSNMTDQYFNILTSSLNATNYQYPTTAFGNCALSVNSAPSFFVLPSVLNITLQYNLTINAPAKVFPNEPFLATVTCPQTPGIDTATLNLIYISSSQKSIFNAPHALNKRYTAGNNVTETTMQSYNVTINQPEILHAPGDLVIGTSYVLELDTSSAFNSSTSPIITAALVQDLMVTAPASVSFGQPVPLKVDTNGPMPTKYTVFFACHAGSFEINGLRTGMTYNLVPSGIYGSVVVTATAVKATPGFLKLQIVKPSQKIPPSFIPGVVPNPMTVFFNDTECII